MQSFVLILFCNYNVTMMKALNRFVKINLQSLTTE